MPIFEFECRSCRKKCEAFLLSKSEAPRCPSCGSTDLARLLSSFSARTASNRAAHRAGGCSCCPASDQCPTARKEGEGS